jgi:hypothetical protein
VIQYGGIGMMASAIHAFGHDYPLHRSVQVVRIFGSQFLKQLRQKSVDNHEYQTPKNIQLHDHNSVNSVAIPFVAPFLGSLISLHLL